VYEYELGNKPSAGRAVGHAVMVVLTLGIWEVIGRLIEAFQGQTRRVSITSNRQDPVLAFNNHPDHADGDPASAGRGRNRCSTR
jgi:hypothetical protein